MFPGLYAHIIRIIVKELGMGYCTFDDAALLASARSDPQGLLASLKRPLVLDEFQMAPSLIGAIKMVSDSADGQKGLFLLTGSSDIFRSAQTQEALPGHMARIELYPLSHSERHDHRCNQIDWYSGDSIGIPGTVYKTAGYLIHCPRNSPNFSAEAFLSKGTANVPTP